MWYSKRVEGIELIYISITKVYLVPFADPETAFKMAPVIASALSSSSLLPTSCKLTGMPWTFSAESTNISTHSTQEFGNIQSLWICASISLSGLWSTYDPSRPLSAVIPHGNETPG